MRRLLVIGLDGYESRVADGLRRTGRMPVLDALFRDAAHVSLEHGAAKRTGLAWEHFATGLAPDAAQRWSAVALDVQRYRCLQHPTALPPFPAALDLPTVVLDAPYFDLSRAPGVRGLVCWGAHDPGVAPQARPRRLLREVRTRFGGYAAARFIYGYTWPCASRTREMGDALVAAVQQRTALARWLLAERCPAWQLAIVVVSELHSASEALWHGVDPAHPLHGLPSAAPARSGMERCYEAVDALIGTLASAFADADLLVFSMHGMGANESDATSMALLPELLHRRAQGRALLRPAPGDPTAGTGPVPAPDEDWSAWMERHFARPRRGARGVTPAAARRVLPAALRRVARLARRSDATKRMSWMPAAWYAEDWPRMEAFALPSFYDGQVRINLEGREAHGRVPLARYEAVCRQVEQDLRACTDPATGRGVVREILRSPRRDPRTLGPTEADLIVVWDGAALALRHPQLGTLGPVPHRRPGGHTGGPGMALLRADGIGAGFHGMRSAFDVVPTIAEHLTGKVRPEWSGRSFLGALAAAPPR